MALACALRGRLRWWFPVYLRTLRFLCFLFDAEPNEERVKFWARRGIVVEVELPGGRWRRIA